MSSSSLKQIGDFMLIDSNGGRCRLVSVRGAESGLDHLEVIVQSPAERELGIATRHKVYTEEVSREQGS